MCGLGLREAILYMTQDWPAILSFFFGCLIFKILEFQSDFLYFINFSFVHFLIMTSPFKVA